MRLGIIGGSAFYSMQNLEVIRREMINTPYGVTSSPVVFGRMCDTEFVFLHRHGFGHTIAPHMINYRANIWAMKDLGITHVIAIAAVGGITSQMEPGKLVIPHQIVDYTYSREHTFFDGSDRSVVHVDFTEPYDQDLRDRLISALQDSGQSFESEGVHAITQGPRLETAAEIERLKRDGCDIVGMTGMPEAGLAREAKMAYATCAVVVNPAAGVNGNRTITMEEIRTYLEQGMESVHVMLEYALPDIIGG